MARGRARECDLAQDALAEALRATGVGVDAHGYCAQATENLITAVTPDLWRHAASDLKAGKGSELEWKFRAAYSSAALVVNTFAPMVDGIDIPGVGLVEGALRLEVERSAGTQGFKPTLDAVVESDDLELMIESKCREYLAGGEADFSNAFPRHAAARLSDAAARVFGDVYAGALSYDPVDAPQLLKDVLAAERRARDSGRHVVLLYAFWEPQDAARYPIFREHGDRVQDVVAPLSQDGVDVLALSYRHLWDHWEAAAQTHIAELRTRYDVPLGRIR